MSKNQGNFKVRPLVNPIVNNHTHVTRIDVANIASLTATYTDLFYHIPSNSSEALKLNAVIHAFFSNQSLAIVWNDSERKWILPQGEYQVHARIFADAEPNLTTKGMYKLVSNNRVEDETHEYEFPIVGNPIHLSLLACISIAAEGGWIQVQGVNTGNGVLQTNNATRLVITRIN